MLKSDSIAKLSSDALCALDQKVVELLVVRLTKRLRELDALLSQLPLGSERLPKAIRRSARISAEAIGNRPASQASFRPATRSAASRRSLRSSSP
jgi:hypothetical protein